MNQTTHLTTPSQNIRTIVLYCHFAAHWQTQILHSNRIAMLILSHNKNQILLKLST